jgi:hypothetical protein
MGMFGFTEDNPLNSYTAEDDALQQKFYLALNELFGCPDVFPPEYAIKEGDSDVSPRQASNLPSESAARDVSNEDFSEVQGIRGRRRRPDLEMEDVTEAMLGESPNILMLRLMALAITQGMEQQHVVDSLRMRALELHMRVR